MNDAKEAALLDWFGARSQRHIETACAHVFLQPTLAYKLKRHVDLGYVDFSTLEKRRWALERELSFNSLTAPDIYRAVRRVTRSAAGDLALDGEGETVDVVLEMRRFDETAVLASDPSALDGTMAEALGRTIAGLHAQAPLRPDSGYPAMAWTVASNARLLRELGDDLGAEAVGQLIARTQAELERQRPLLTARAAAGFSRRCHGDLHLGNILVENGAPVLFDCIEFNDLLSDIDVQYDVAFLLMDLDFRGRRDAGVRVLSAYLDAASRVFPSQAVFEGLAALPLMMAVRAAVRAHVCAHSGDLETARAYVAAGLAHLAPPSPRLAALGGLSGSGKSTVARRLAPHLGAAPGAVILRTDELRKRLAGAGPTEKLPPSAYAAEMNARVYQAMFDAAGVLLRAGHAVVLDATFIDPALRVRARDLAMEVGTPFDAAWLEAPAPVLRARVGARRDDASDADLTILEAQLSRDPGRGDWTVVDASGDDADAARDCARIWGLTT